MREECGQVAQPHEIVGSPAIDHILPDQHAQPVAVIVETLRLQFAVDPHHIKVQIPDPADIRGHGCV